MQNNLKETTEKFQQELQNASLKLKETIDESKRVNGKLSKSTINKIKKILKKG